MTESEKLRELENRLWQAADQLRANSSLAEAQYSTPVLGRIGAWPRDHGRFDSWVLAELLRIIGSIPEHVFQSYRGDGQRIYEEAA